MWRLSILWNVGRLTMLAFALPLMAAAPPAFVTHTIASDLKGGYQVVVADLNHDGKPDLIALASGQPELVWYENPGWERHVIVGGQRQMINCAVVGDEIVLASEFANVAKNSVGRSASTRAAIDVGVGGDGLSTVQAPTEKGKVSELPSP